MSQRAAERNVPTLEEAYARFTPLFFAALARLARQGFIASPSDSMDLIHDFFIDGWKTLEKNFDPSKGSLESYAYVAFIRFTRPRIVRLRRWNDSLVGDDRLDVLEATEQTEIDDLDRQRIQRAVAALPSFERELLIQLASSDYLSQRDLANSLGLSRYRVREMLIDALGHLAVSFDRPRQIRQQDWEVVCALWRDHRTMHEASTVLRLSLEQIRSASRRYVGFLSESLREYQPQTWSPQRRRNMATRSQLKPALELFYRALASHGDDSALQAVREHAAEIVETLDEVGPMSLDQLNSLSPEWVAKIYESLFVGLGVSLRPEVEKGEAEEAHRSEDSKIGEAFRDVLLADLGKTLQFPAEIASLDEISGPDRARLSMTPDVLAARDVSAWWVAHGIRPLTVFYATKAISGLLERYFRHGLLRGESVVLGDDSITVGDRDLVRPLSVLLREEISRRAECEPRTSQALYSWLLRVAQYKPWLFAGFEAQPMREQSLVCLVCRPEDAARTYRYWGLPTPAANHSRTLAPV